MNQEDALHIKRRRFLSWAGGMFIAAGTVASHGCGGGGGGTNPNGSGGGTRFSATDRAVHSIEAITREGKSLDQILGEVKSIVGVKDATVFERNIFVTTIDDVTIIMDFSASSQPSVPLNQQRQQKLHSSRSIPAGNRAVLLNGFTAGGWQDDGWNSISDSIQPLLMDAGYKVEKYASNIESLMSVGECSLLYISGHGEVGSSGTAYISTATEHYDGVLNDLARQYQLKTHGTDADVIIQTVEYTNPAPLYGKTYRTEVVVTSHFIRNKMDVSFTGNSLVYIDGCKLGKSTELLDFFKEKKASVFVGWNESILDVDAYYTTNWIFDRLLGTNSFFPPLGSPNSPIPNPFSKYDVETPPQRAFDIDSLMMDMRQRNPRLDRYDYPSERFSAELILERLNPKVVDDANPGFGQLAPAIALLTPLGGSGRLALLGTFGSVPGHVEYRGGAAFPITVAGKPYWENGTNSLKLPSPTGDGTTLTVAADLTVVDLPKNYSGPVTIVLADGRQSNTRTLTRWRGSFVLRRGSEDDNYEVSCNLIIIGDVGDTRITPGNKPLATYQVPNEAGQSTEVQFPNRFIYNVAGINLTVSNSSECQVTTAGNRFSGGATQVAFATLNYTEEGASSPVPPYFSAQFLGTSDLLNPRALSCRITLKLPAAYSEGGEVQSLDEDFDFPVEMDCTGDNPTYIIRGGRHEIGNSISTYGTVTWSDLVPVDSPDKNAKRSMHV